ncbi:MAG TPA: RNA polymerase sigma factor [Pyrinomonadaceae bacterium]|jgi:RNA polymerase sigma-70 factor (ECF subfamily)
MVDQAMTFGEAHSLLQGVAEKAAPTEASQYDYQLARRIADGDMPAFEELYGRYHRRLYNLCLRMTGRHDEAEDLTQEAFIQIYHKIGSFRGESALMTWLYRLTTNQVLMHFRKHSVRREQVSDDGETPEPKVDTAAIPSQTLAVDRLALDSAIAKLAPGYRIVFILHDVEGYQHAEIARICGNTVGTSKSQLHKARMKLRELLKQEAQPVEPELDPVT